MMEGSKTLDGKGGRWRADTTSCVPSKALATEMATLPQAMLSLGGWLAGVAPAPACGPQFTSAATLLLSTR